ncbi:DUF1343 domain-containing protein [Polaribacter sp. BAL334]|uniref:exo-beta-N-acetylmuramidase NamZ family protein n=1 Tax=Polaribacter sp. BAL334 TaxID=1708178 RepID=UPI0018D24DF1|nr:DUF1343 domain-containing protein [Polaribacter sp. BAL334]MBG7613233.1 DUF1343 domain-containing protein [Polaribacter sp. BAL334]
MLFLKLFKSTYLFSVLFLNFGMTVCGQSKNNSIEVGAERFDLYVPLLEGKKVGIVGNHTSIIVKENNSTNFTHLADTLISLKIEVKKLFSPEHGFRGSADAGELIVDGKDTKTGLEIVSLYAENKKPTAAQLEGIDVIVFDLQDVGVRFFTYISTLHYVLEACGELNIPVIILDRPNPNAHYIDGPVLELEHTSFVGLHRVPVVYGMTIGEYGQMIVGEKWLLNEIQCDVTVIPIANYNHKKRYSLPVKPSPNLPNDKSINLYPSLCFFEGTSVSVGRGTEMQFQVYGSPFLNDREFQFIPKPNNGSKYPKHEGLICYGKDLREIEDLEQINLEWLLDTYQQNTYENPYFTIFFTKLAGTKKLQEQIEQGFTEREIRKSWKDDLRDFKEIRKKYLIYR